jgi:hypothetical protein
MPDPSFKSLFCQRFGCAPEEYEERAFRKFLYFHARLAAPLLRLVYPTFFEHDFQFIRFLGEATDSRQAKVDVLDFKDAERKHWGMLHGGLMLRVSGRKARRTAFELLGRPSLLNDYDRRHEKVRPGS